MREIYRSGHFLITFDDERLLLRRIRTDVRFESLEEVVSVYEAVLRASEPFAQGRYLLLADVRLAPPRNDPAYEQVVDRYFLRLYTRYRKISFLSKTEAGRLQISRIAQRHGLSVRGFLDEQAAIAYLTDPQKP